MSTVLKYGSIIASFHGTHCASPSRAAAPRPRYHGGACCFAAKPTPAAAVAPEPDQDVDDEGGVLGAANGADANAPTRKKRRARKGKRSAAALQQEAAEEEARRKAEEEEAAAKKKKAEEESRAAALDLDEVMAVSPVGLGRRSRQLFDEVWRKFSRLGQMSSASATEALAEEEQAVLSRGGPMCEFTVPGAQDTTVLVVGATSRIGRIVVRKLMLRGYNVKVLFPPRAHTSSSFSTLSFLFTVMFTINGKLATEFINLPLCNRL